MTHAGEPDGGYFPEQRLNLAEAIEGFTYGAAFAARQEGRRGRLEPGFACDMTVIDCGGKAFGEIEASDVLSARVVRTVVNGEIVFEGAK